jgi:organic hydroperoxide reductase OsmC/OhrA
MKISATELADDSKSILDRIIQRGDVAEVQRHTKTVVEIRRKVGADRREMLELLAKINFTKSETRELKQAMDAAAEVCRYAASGH